MRHLRDAAFIFIALCFSACQDETEFKGAEWKMTVYDQAGKVLEESVITARSPKDIKITAAEMCATTAGAKVHAVSLASTLKFDHECKQQ